MAKKQDQIRKRTKTTPSEFREHLLEICEQRDYNPAVALLDLVKGEKNALKQQILSIAKQQTIAPLRKQLMDIAEVVGAIGLSAREVVDIHKELLQYIAPKLRSLDISGEIDTNLTVVVRKFKEAEDVRKDKRIGTGTDG
jgi:hypothetical protein